MIVRFLLLYYIYILYMCCFNCHIEISFGGKDMCGDEQNKKIYKTISFWVNVFFSPVNFLSFTYDLYLTFPNAGIKANVMQKITQ